MFAIPKIRGAIAAALLGLVGIASVTPAQAIIVGTRWDPIYGSPFLGADNTTTSDDMWWAGRGQVFIDNSCVLPGLGSGYQIVTGCNMQVQQSFIDLSLGEPPFNDPFATRFDTLDFSGDTVKVFEAQFFNGQLVGIRSDYFDPWVQGTKSSPFNTLGYKFTYAFDFNGAVLYHASQTFVERHVNGHEDSEQFWNGQGNGHLTAACSLVPVLTDGELCGFSDVPATVTFDRIGGPPAEIPEPQTYALMLLGLAAIGMTARRRKAGQD